MDETTQMVLGSFIRHAATTAGGWLISHGYLQSDGLQGFVGGIMILAAVVWSWWQKSGQAAVLTELQMLKARREPVGAANKSPA